MQWRLHIVVIWMGGVRVYLRAPPIDLTVGQLE
jgi:hypothetical protein